MKSFFSYSRGERIGILSLVILILVVFVTSFLLRNYSPQTINIEEEKLNLAWQKMQAEQNENNTESVANNTSKELFYFDPNSLDSVGFLRLGLQPKTIKYLLNWRRKGKHFYKTEDLKPLYSLSENEYNRLAPFVQIAASETQNNFYEKERLAPLPDHLNLNKTDSATLVRLKGIGNILAHKIVTQRKALGGFINHNQLLEIYKFPDTTFTYLKEKLIINPSEIRKININTATEAELAIHPYIGEKMAKNIVLLRSGLKNYENISQLRQVPLMNEEKYRKIAVYCTIQ